jgi:hypothetical protein
MLFRLVRLDFTLFETIIVSVVIGLIAALTITAPVS